MLFKKIFLFTILLTGTSFPGIYLGILNWPVEKNKSHAGYPIEKTDSANEDNFSYDEIIPKGASWKYLDNGSNQGTAWRSLSFNDSAWNTGNAELGYGDGGEATKVSYGPAASNKYITTYFRKLFYLQDTTGLIGLELSLLRDDGAVVYLNGLEVYRSNMKTGTIYYNTLASSAIYGSAESTFKVANISYTPLTEDTNVIAVELHQNSISSSDISFNLKLRTIISDSGLGINPGLFAFIGDYGKAGLEELAVANLVKSWLPEFIFSAGDNNYPYGASSTIDANIGQYFHNYISPYNGNYGSGGEVNRFYPSLGNHDVMTSSGYPYFQYFTLPGNERYYDVVIGNVHFYAINSNKSEPNGYWSTSTQGTWLKNKLASSVSGWNVVYFHHSPYASDTIHGSQSWMQWPFKTWGADVVISSHSHVYERIFRNNITYIVNGLGGDSRYNFKTTPVYGSIVRYNSNYGALQMAAKPDTLYFKFYNIYNTLIDNFKIVKPSQAIKPDVWVNEEKIHVKNSGSFEYGFERIRIYPNPGSHKINFRYCNTENKDCDIEIHVTDKSGKIVYEKHIDMIQDCTNEIIEIDKKLPGGIYFIGVACGDKTDYVKYVVME